MERKFDNITIIQRTKDKFFCATDLLKHYNNHSLSNKRITDFMSLQDTQDFLVALAKEEKVDDYTPFFNDSIKRFYQWWRWRWWKTYMHPYLFVKFAMWLSKEFEVKVIKWVYDNLIDFRNSAWDYYKEMCAVIQQRYLIMNWKTPDPLIFSSESRFINELIWVNSWERNKISEDKLKLINELQKAYINLANNWFNRYQIHEKLRDYLMMKI